MRHNPVVAYLASTLLTFALTDCGAATFSSNTRKAPQAGAAATALPTSDSTTGAPVLTALAVTPVNPTVTAGATQPFVATGTFSDGSTKVLTSTATWSVGSTSVAKVNSSLPGSVVALAAGTSLVTATSGKISGTTTLTVTAAILKSIAVTAVSTTVGTPVQVKATGTYSDGTTADITSQVTWSSATPTVATISNTAGSIGLLTPLTGGTSVISATLSGVTGSNTATVNATLACTSPEQVLSAGQTQTLTWSGLTDTTFSIAAISASPPATLGSLSVSSVTAPAPLTTVFSAPATIATSYDINVVATPADPNIAPVSCKVRLQATGALGVTDDGTTVGLVGNVYQLGVGTNSTVFATAADWNSVPPPTPIATIVMQTIAVPNTPYALGFPGFPNLVQWFAIRLDGTLMIPTTGAYQFELASDDGSLLYIDGALAVNDDGVHPVATVAGAPIQLTAGVHTLHIDYFQGPPVYLALELLWQVPGSNTFVVIPSQYFGRPPGPAVTTATTTSTSTISN